MITKPNFIHLHVHSEYSTFASCATIEKLVEKAKQLDMTSLALTDCGSMFGAVNFYNLCRENNIKPIIGQEFYFADGASLILLCESDIGYKNLSWLSSRSYCDKNALKKGKPTITFELLKEYHEGLVCLSGGFEGEIAQNLLNGKTEKAYESAKQYKELFGKNHFYIELQNHGLAEEKTVAKELVKLAQDLDISLVATNDIHYLEQEDAEAWIILQCIGSKKKFSDLKEKLCEEKYFKSKTEMEKSLSEIENLDESVIKNAIENTIKIADMCNAKIPKYEKSELKNNLPRIPLPNEFKTQDEYLRHLVEEGLKNRYKEITKEIRSRADYELETISKLGFSGYYLFIWEFSTWAKSTWDNVTNRAKPYFTTYARGAANSSLVAYCLGISDVDPIKYGLIFECFINPLEDAIPDFDMDTDYNHISDAIGHFKKLYGKKCVAGIEIFDTLGPVFLIKQVARVLDIPSEHIKQMTDSPIIFPHFKLKNALMPADEKHPNNGCLLPFKDNAEFEKLFEIVLKLEDVKCRKQIHGSGIVISHTDLPNLMPLFKDEKTGKVAVQSTRHEIEACGLVKFDFLGFKILPLIQEMEMLISEKSGNSEFKISQISENDEETFDLFRRGDTKDVFGFDFERAQEYLKQLNPTCMEDLIALNALSLPSAMDYIPTFIAEKRNPASIKYTIPCLEKILGETYGVVVYQEQIMQILQKIAGYSLAKAEIFRRDLRKRNADIIAERKKEFTDDALKNGYDIQTANEIFELLANLSPYTFNKSHAAMYTKLTYQTAWLKCHYPEEFAEVVLRISSDF